MIAPWTIRNATELHAFVPVSTETGSPWSAPTTRESAAFASVPYKWRFVIKLPEDRALLQPRRPAGRGAAVRPAATQALDYISAHPSAPLEAGWHNLTRMLELEGSYAWHASAAAVGLSVGTAHDAG